MTKFYGLRIGDLPVSEVAEMFACMPAVKRWSEGGDLFDNIKDRMMEGD